MSGLPRFDEIGYWSEIKLEIIRAYAAEYSKILHAQKDPAFSYVYIDAFAGAGVHIARSTGEFVPGSPLNALLVEPPFKEYHFVDLDRQKAEFLREMVGERADVYVYAGDCNELLPNVVFPRARYEDYRRALCLLDPYGLHLHWDVLRQAGASRSIDIFLNFPIMDMNMNVLWHDPEATSQEQRARMDAFWGDDSWRSAAYSTQGNLFGYDEKLGNDAIARAFQRRLTDVAGFEHVLDPMPMRNRTGAIVYYLFFASQKLVAGNIVRHIFRKYRNRGGGGGR
jgi:three-Cys-motif partner protein